MRRRTAWKALAATVGVLALAACTAMPTSGPVSAGDPQVTEPGGVDLLAEGPTQDAPPEKIVEGFLLAGAAGLADDFVVAREFLAGEARSSWEPLAGVVVASSQEIQLTSPTQVTLSVPVTARVDADGRYVEAPADARESVTFDMVQDDDDQWRIATVPTGLILTRPVFDSQFRSTPVYFLSPDKQFLVPDTRWFPNKNVASYVVQALLAGPSPWLRDAVESAVPDGVDLVPGAVTIGEDGVAVVELGPQAAVLGADRDLLVAQIEASLRVPRVGSVQVVSGGVVLTGATTPDLDRGALPSLNVEFLQADTLVELAGTEVAAVPDVAPLAGLGAASPARSEDGSVRVLLTQAGLMTVPTADAPGELLVPGNDLVAPSVDRLGRAWTARTVPGSEDPTLLAAAPGRGTVEIVVDWLAGRRVQAVRVSRDGTRIAVVSDGPDGVAVDVAGVMRDDEGTPVQVGEPVRAGASLTEASEVVWVDESVLGVLGRSGAGSALHLVPVSGPTEVLPEMADVVSIAGGRGERAVLVATSDGELFRSDGLSWVRVAGVEGASDPSYPG
ncbi:LpqB family beta-propeller domain-containing protein [Cellulomonas soli]|uniref:LpqB family beta-propeller domain-containing protein n=1 Tax=Cellulomonas soli TaxID=931535 RepID=UPI003F875B70